MLDQMKDQFANAMKPVNALIEINTKAVEALVSQQTAFASELLNESVAHAKTMATQNDLNAALETQKAYTEAFQAKVSGSATEAYAVVTKTSEEISNLMKDSMAEVAKAAK